jgi:methylaspartate ammonia-lyase
LDVHGALGKIFQNNVTKVGDYLREIEELLSPYKFRIESPMLVESVESQIAIYSSLRSYLVKTGSKVQLAADEWANTKQDIQKFADSRCVDLIHIKTPDLGSVVDVVDAVLYCKAQGMGVLLGGSCVETDISTRATVHVAMATRPDFLLVKPGMGFDEGFMLCQGEMARIRCM